ncbi:MAG: hypothetical protein FD123_4285 [Bacteroidetes bacterium]|nr:MAG: hypothetical protein FD123_4285 [Bacteroidota bacterium]
MAEHYDNNRDSGGELFSKPVKAGKRTYFFDVKSTRGNDYYLTITESKKRIGDDGKFFYEKHKLFLYKEDFDKFSEGLQEAIAYIKAHASESNTATNHQPKSEVSMNGTAVHSNVNFEDLG